MPQPGLIRTASFTLGRTAFTLGRTCLLGLALLAALAAAPIFARAADVDDAARLDAIKAHLADIIVPDVRLAFEEAGPRLPYEELPGGQALVYAAYYYALTTGDFAVSYADLQDHGYWPYDIYDAQYRGDYLYGFTEEPPLYPYRAFEDGLLGCQGDQLDAALMADTATPEWIYHARAEILERFYRGYFDYYADDPFAAVERLKPCAPFWDVDGLEDADSIISRTVEEVAVSRFVNRTQCVYLDSRPGEAPPADPLDSLMVKSFAGDIWQKYSSSSTNVNINSGYYSQYREQTRSAQGNQESAAPAAPAQ